MATNRTRRRDEEEDEDDRPRRRRRAEDDEDDRPRGRRRRDDEAEDRPRRRRRDADDEEDARPRRRPKRKGRGGPGAGLIVGLVLGGLAVVGGVVLLVLVGGSGISYAKFKEISSADTIPSLEKRLGKAKKLEKSAWATTRFGDGGPDGGGRPDWTGGGNLAALSQAYLIDNWYHWHSGSEDVYVGTDRHGLSWKVYNNTDAANANARAGGDPNKLVPAYELKPVTPWPD
ncbi:MAG: hypothetical protein C0501_07785 [Isosphaera sp.]|nr:hypothetical protein [Isosphaera sp.]